MKLLYTLVFSIVLFTACTGNKQKKPDSKTTETNTNNSQEDEIIKKWLQGKEWKAESEAAPIGLLRTFSMDSCDYVYGKGPWNYKNAEFSFGVHDLVSWPFVKLSDTTFTLYVAPTKKTYTYRFIKNL